MWTCYSPRVRVIAAIVCYSNFKQIKNCLQSLTTFADLVFLYYDSKIISTKTKLQLEKLKHDSYSFPLLFKEKEQITKEAIFNAIQDFLTTENGDLTVPLIHDFYKCYTNYFGATMSIVDLIFDYLNFWDPSFSYAFFLDSTMSFQSNLHWSRYKYKLTDTTYSVKIVHKDQSCVWKPILFNINAKDSCEYSSLCTYFFLMQKKNFVSDDELYSLGYIRFCEKKYKSATYLLTRKINLKDSTEETWHSKYLLATIYLEERNWEKAQSFLLECYNDRPTRVEALYVLITEYRSRGLYILANFFLTKAINTHPPMYELIPLEVPKYTYLLIYEICKLACINNQCEMGSDACDKIRLMKNSPRKLKNESLVLHKLYLNKFVGHFLRTFTHKNFPQLSEEKYIGSAHLISLRRTHFTHLNLKFSSDEKKILLITFQILNYKREATTGYPEWNNKMKKFQCHNLLCFVNYETLEIIKTYLIYDHRPTLSRSFKNLQYKCGMERMKLFTYQHVLWCTFHSSDHRIDRIYQVGFARLEYRQKEDQFVVENPIYLPNLDIHTDEKQWLFFPCRDQRFLFLYSCSPVQFVEIDPESLTVKKKQIDGLNFDFRFRNASGPIRWEEDNFLVIVREQILEKKNPKVTVHRFLVYDGFKTLLKASRPFFFTDLLYEYVNGCISYKNGILLSVGTLDMKTSLFFILKTQLNQMLLTVDTTSFPYAHIPLFKQS